MEHRGVEYRIIQGIKPGVWKWSVETETGTKSGTSDRKDAAVIAVIRKELRSLRSERRDELHGVRPRLPQRRPAVLGGAQY